MFCIFQCTYMVRGTIILSVRFFIRWSSIIWENLTASRCLSIWPCHGSFGATSAAYPPWAWNWVVSTARFGEDPECLLWFSFSYDHAILECSVVDDWIRLNQQAALSLLVTIWGHCRDVGWLMPCTASSRFYFRTILIISFKYQLIIVLRWLVELMALTQRHRHYDVSLSIQVRRLYVEWRNLILSRDLLGLFFIGHRRWIEEFKGRRLTASFLAWLLLDWRFRFMMLAMMLGGLLIGIATTHGCLLLYLLGGQKVHLLRRY